MKNTAKLNQLTSLRFFAALMIVYHHSVGMFGIESSGVNWGQGVSFFFVLSGFILAYVYPRLDRTSEILGFWRARFARIWPAYVVSLVLWLLLFREWAPATLLANLFMVQAWVPMTAYYFSYNAVAWSVSTEAFFYLVFPLLLWGWGARWKTVWALSGVVLASLLYVVGRSQLPEYGDPASGSDGLLISQHGLVYISPLSRLFEFVFGMGIATLWRKRVWVIGTARATVLEVIALVACAASIHGTVWIAHMGALAHLGRPVSLWLIHSGSVIAFGFLIYILAHGRGWVAKALSAPVLVLLGEISFSLYLLHQMLLIEYGRHSLDIAWVSEPVQFGLFLLVLVVLSYFMWRLVEVPGRRLLLGQGIGGGAERHAAQAFWRTPGRRGVVAGTLALLLGLAVLQVYTMPTTHAVETPITSDLTTSSAEPYLGAEFGGMYRLRGLGMVCEGTQLAVTIAWEKTGESRGRMTNAVHIVDTEGGILSQADYVQSRDVMSMSVGSVWLDRLAIPAGKLGDPSAKLALGIYDRKGRLLTISHERTDWNGQRLLVALKRCPDVASHAGDRKAVSVASMSPGSGFVFNRMDI